MNKKIKLFCIPYAGGSAVIYSKWKAYLPDTIELCPIELKGRGARIVEPRYENIDEAVQDIYDQILPQIQYAPYALFGHSMGAMLCHELALKLRSEDVNQPKHLFFSGRSVPHIKMKEDKKYHLLSEEDFKKKVKTLGGTPKEFFDHPELMELFLPLLRSDFKLASTDLSLEVIVPFNCDISVLLGKDEDMTAQQAHEWKDHTKGLCTTYYFNGGHFFLNNEVESITRIIARDLNVKVSEPVYR